MKKFQKFSAAILWGIFTAQLSFASLTNLIDNFDSLPRVVFGIDNSCRVQVTNKFFTKANALELSFSSNSFLQTKNFYIKAPNLKYEKNDSLYFDVYLKARKNLTLFYEIFFNSNKYVSSSTRLARRKKTTVEIPVALSRGGFKSISLFRFFITNDTKNVRLYFDNFRMEKSSFSPFEKISYFELADDFSFTGLFFFSRGILSHVFKNTNPFSFEKIEKINLCAAKGETLFFPLSFKTSKERDKVFLRISDFVTKETNNLSAKIKIGVVEFLDKRLSSDSKFYIAELPTYVQQNNFFTNIPMREARTFFIEIFIPNTAKAEIYHGDFFITSVTKSLTNKYQIPVNLRVFPFAIAAVQTTNLILNCDMECLKPEVDRYASGFFIDSNNIVKTLPQEIRGDAFDDFDRARGDCVRVYPQERKAIAAYAINAGKIDLQYLKRANKRFKKKMKTTPPLSSASKWTAMLTKEQVKLTGKPYDKKAAVFVAGEQELPNGWSKKDYERARVLLARNIIEKNNGLQSNDTTSAPPELAVVAAIAIPLSRPEKKKQKSETVYSVRELLLPPLIDKNFDKAKWRTALKIKKFNLISGAEDDVMTEAQIGWHGSNFYIFVNLFDITEKELADIYLKKGNKNKTWEKYSVNYYTSKLIATKSDGKTFESDVKFCVGKSKIKIEIPLTNCLLHSEDFGLNICRQSDGNYFAWKSFNKNKIKFAHIKLDGADNVISSLIEPLKKEPLKIIQSDAFAFGAEDVVSLEITWDGARNILNRNYLKFKFIDSKGKITTGNYKGKILPRQKIFLKLKNFPPDIYTIAVELTDSVNTVINSSKTKIEIIDDII